ncbi:MAG: aromatic ring-hydroxylating oxygenase subunit alpha [Sphingopyxis sp.]
MADTGTALPNFIETDAERGSFRVNRKAYSDQAVFDAELRRVFDRCWLYLGHVSELAKPNSYVLRTIAGRPLIFSRGADDEVRAFLNICPHRGAQIARERSGSAKSFTCIYHGWSWNNKGEMIHLQGEDGFCDKFNACGEVNLLQVPRLESYRGLVFINFDENAMSLSDYLADAKDFIDIIFEQSEADMQVVGGTQEYSIRCNWKGLAENSIDIYHGPGTHPSYIDYLITATPGVIPDLANDQGRILKLGNGHGVAEYYGPWGRPIADWKSSLGEAIRPEIEAKEREIEARLGTERAERVTKRSFNLLIFPNLALLNIHAVAIRSFQPVRPNYMDAFMWMLAPADDSEAMKAARLNNFLEFLGPGGFATPDDIEALETCQIGYDVSARSEMWNEVSKGIPREDNENWMDEGHMRAFWTQWNRLMTGAEA